jgi:hypothetical protein
MNDSGGIRCGHCGGRHGTVAEVRDCSTEQVVFSAPPATEKQVAYVIDLMSKRQQPDWQQVIGQESFDVDNLTKREASMIIDALTKQPVKAATNIVPEVIPDGRYAYMNHDLGKIVFYRVVTRKDGYRLVQKVLGSPGDFRYEAVYNAEAEKFVEAIEDDPAFASQMFGISVGACGVCGSPLTDPISIRMGIGPVCAGKNDW